MRSQGRVGFGLAAVVACLCACAPHHRLVAHVRPAMTSGKAIAHAFSGEELDKLEKVVGRIARRWEMDRIDGASRRDGWKSVVRFYGPYPGSGNPAEAREHPAYMIQMFAWVREDQRVLSVWVTDWQSVNVSEQLRIFRKQLEPALREAFPDYEVEVEFRVAGWIAP